MFNHARPSSRFLAWRISTITVSLSLLPILTWSCRIFNVCDLGSKQSIARVQLAEMKGALQLYAYDTGNSPTSAEGLDVLIHSPSGSLSWKGPYLRSTAIPDDPWNRPYIFISPGRHGPYEILSYGKDGIEGGSGEDEDCIVPEPARGNQKRVLRSRVDRLILQAPQTRAMKQ